MRAQSYVIRVRESWNLCFRHRCRSYRKFWIEPDELLTWVRQHRIWRCLSLCMNLCAAGIVIRSILHPCAIRYLFSSCPDSRNSPCMPLSEYYECYYYTTNRFFVQVKNTGFWPVFRKIHSPNFGKRGSTASWNGFLNASDAINSVKTLLYLGVLRILKKHFPRVLRVCRNYDIISSKLFTFV